MNTIRRKNPKKQGEIGLADAIAWFTHAGWLVSVPLVDAQKYDLIIDDGSMLQRVQVKTATHRSPYGPFTVDLATNGGNRSRSTSVPFQPGDYELLYVLTDDGSRFVIPAEDLGGRWSVTLGAKYARFAVSSPQLTLAY
jgi:hypothetical protein